MLLKNFIIVFLIIFCGLIYGQNGNNKYRITFTDKNNNPYSLQNPGQFLAQRALDRRQKYNIPLTTEDLPVTPAYIDSVVAKGFQLHCINKWFNSIVVEANDTVSLAPLYSLPFVASIDTVFKYKASFGRKSWQSQWKNNFVSSAADYGYAVDQIEMIKLDFLHANGWNGKGKIIAVMDAGFQNVDNIAGFQHLFQNGQILGTWDFVAREPSVYEDHPHGTAVLSIIAAYQPGKMVGGAYASSFYLFRTEDVFSESLVEEDNWVAAAEKADSLGVDIIQTSLGYFEFDHQSTSHQYSEMNGNTTRISQGANKAMTRGMLVVVSAGNEGNAPWHYITAPADADSVISVGAVNKDKILADFSSRGPSSDGQIKPEVCAMGQATVVYASNGDALAGSGTSFASPLISAGAACLWQVFDEKNAWQIRDLILKSCDRYLQPNNDYGYGIPDFSRAVMSELQLPYEEGREIVKLLNGNVGNGPLQLLIIPAYDGMVTIDLMDVSGKLLQQRSEVIDKKQLKIYKFDTENQGFFLLRVETPLKKYVFKILNP